MINVYLSNDGSTWIDKYPSTSPYANQPLSSYVEDRGLNIYAQVAFANSSPTKLTINVSGYSSCLAPFKEYKYIKVTEDSSVQFIGTQASSTETVDSQVTRTLSIIYDDLSSTWKDLTFGDIESLAVTTGVVMPCSDPNIDWDKTQSKLVIQKYIDELDSHLNNMENESSSSVNASLQSQLLNEKTYWTNVLEAYDGQGGLAKHELKKTTTDNIKVCDNTDKQHSMVHILFALLTNIPVNTTYQDTTIVRFFYAMDEDNVLDTVCEFLAQNGLGWFIDYPNNQIKVVSYDATSTATAVQYVETKAQIRTDPTKLASANEQQNAQFIANVQTEVGSPLCKMFDTTKGYNKLVMASPWSYGDTYKFDGIGVCYPPAEDRRYLYNGVEYNANIPQVGSIEPDKDVRVIKKRFFWEKRPTNSVYDKSSKSWRQYPYLFGVEGGDYYTSNPYFEMTPYKSSLTNQEYEEYYGESYSVDDARGQILVLYIDNDVTIKYAFASNKKGSHWAGKTHWGSMFPENRQKSGFSYLRIFANVTKAIWSSVNHADSYTGLKSSSDDVIKLQYIFTVEGMERFRKANYWYRISDAQSWTFNSPTRYEVMQALQISGVDSTYVLVTKREKDLATGTYKYTCVKAPTTEFAYNGQGIITNVDVPFDPTAFDFNVNRVLAMNANGTPKDTTPIRVSVNQVYDYPTVTLEYNGNSYQANNEDGKIVFDIPVMDIAENYTGIIKNTYNDFETTKTFKIDVVSDGEAGATGPQGPKGNDGDSAVIEYALGSSADYPPVEKMYWNDEVMMWESEVMTWDEILWTKNVPTPDRGQYVWMRTIVGSGSWQYTRLTGSTLQDADYFGVLENAPTTTPDGKNLIAGDSYVDSETNAIKVYNGSSWVSLAYSGLTSAKQSEIAGKAQKNVLARIKPGSVTESDYGYFNTLIAGTVTAGFISGIDGEFENLRIGRSQFDGNITAQAIESYDSSNGAPLSFVCEPNSNNLLKATVLAQLGAYGTYVVTSGAITLVSTSDRTKTKTYIATESDTFKIQATASYFAIIRSSDSAKLVGVEVSDSTYYKIFSRPDNLSRVEITANSLVLATQDAGIKVGDVIPMSETSTVGTETNPFTSIFTGQFGFNHGISNTYTTGYTSLPNGYQLKWGCIKASDNEGEYMPVHTYTTEEGGAFQNDTLFVIAYTTDACRVIGKVYPAYNNPNKRFAVEKLSLTSTSIYTTGATIFWVALGC